MKMFRIPLRVVFYKEEGSWIAHCLEFDLCGDGVTQVEALSSLDESIKIQVEETLAHNNPRNLFSPAPSEVWEKFFAGNDIAVGALKVVTEPVDHLTFEHSEYREYSDDDALAV
jgi:predicted RNase H-like HicB family nuclease